MSDLSDVKHALDRLRGDVTGARMAPAAEVRRAADRRGRRHAAWGSVPAAAVLAAAMVWVPSGAFHNFPDGGGSVNVAPAAPQPHVERAWLPHPWAVESTRSVSMETAGDDFCGTAQLVDQRAVRQVLSRGTGTARIYAFPTGSLEDAGRLRERIWAQCGPRGGLTFEEEALYGRTRDGAPVAVVQEDAIVYIVVAAVRGRPTAPPDLPEIVALMIHTVR
jgi:hypothetical protein